MPFQRQRQLRRRYPHAVVADPAQPRAALFYLHDDPPGARVEAVFRQFLDHRGGALHHFARGDLVDQVVGQQLNRHCIAAKTLRVLSGRPSR